MEEIWKDIPNYESLYQVSNLSNVRSLNYNGKKFIKNLKQCIKHKSYYGVGLCKKGIKKEYLTHRLVAEAFLNKENFKSMPYEDRNLIDYNILQVNHKDENMLNDNLDNLEWCTPKYNANHGTRNKKLSLLKCKKIKQYDLDGNFIREWNSITEVNLQLGYLVSSIAKCCNKIKKHKTAYGYKWEFSDKEEN